MTNDTRKFYELLEAFPNFTDLSDPGMYRPLPDDWCVVITDVENSTRAIEDGKYKQVNSIGVASIVAVRNALTPASIPYVFGGDGATLCLPEALLEQATPALLATRRLARERFNLDLRVGVVKMTDIRRAGFAISVGKYSPNPHYQQAMLVGDGIDYVGKLVKQPTQPNPYLLSSDGSAMSTCDSAIYEGFECRWNEIPSPHGEDIALIAQATGGDDSLHHRIHGQLLEDIRDIYGDDTAYNPLREDKLALTGSFQRLSIEAGIRTAFQPSWKRIGYLLMLQLYRWAGILLMKAGRRTETSDWGAYRRNLIANTDYRKLDQALRMIISGSHEQHARLRSCLERYRTEGKLVFGMHASPCALITCIVTDYNKDHVHFLDGADGGYAMAARELKAQLLARAHQVGTTDMAPAGKVR